MTYSADDIQLWRTQSDEQFLVDCRCDAFRGSGPGGQKRNKTSSAVRITHLPTGLFAVSSETRSKGENQRHALRRLRHRVSVELRGSLPADGDALAKAGSTLKISVRSEEYLPLVGLVVDLLAEAEWSISLAAGRLNTTTGQLIAFLSRDEPLWAYTNQQRAVRGLRALNSKK